MIAWQVAACCCALCSGAVFSGIIQDAWARKRRKQQSRARIHLAPRKAAKNASEALLGLWEKASLEQQAKSNNAVLRLCRGVYGVRAGRWMQKNACFMGNPTLSLEGLCATCFSCAVTGACACFIFGYTFGLPAAGLVLFCLVGALFGGRIPQRVGSSYIRQRACAMEQELPQMLSMIALGLHGGLSFDRSFALYAKAFNTEFARACANAQRRWEMSLSTREEALRDLGASYDSSLFQQAIESMIRSLRLGTALAENLEALAGEARNQYQSSCQEAIAKAPVKMLVPTGTLILPAMLLLVMGPILLEMMGGF